MSAIAEQDIKAALASVIDPEGRKDIVAMGWVSAITIKEGHVHVALDAPADRRPRLEPLRRAAERAVDKLDGVLSATVVVTGAPATTSPPAAATAQPTPRGSDRAAPVGGGRDREPKALVPGVRSIVAVASGKGGVGKSTTAINLALALAAQGLRIGLMDADIYGPSVPTLLGLKDKPISEDGQTLTPLSAHGISCMSMGFIVPEDTPMIWRGPMVMSALEQMLRDVNWGQLDMLVVDMPPGTGDAQLTMAQRVPLTGAVIVSTPQDLALIDARKGLNMFRQVEVPVLGIVENMSLFICPHCGKESRIFGHGGARAEAEKLKVPFLGEVPLNMDIRIGSDAGAPIMATAPDGPLAQAYRDIANQVWNQVGGLIGAGARQAPKITVS
ncbi:MAG: iron-sulfur cluster carrier protein ApbC [Alphaproteobacteria bacterium]